VARGTVKQRALDNFAPPGLTSSLLRGAGQGGCGGFPAVESGIGGVGFVR